MEATRDDTIPTGQATSIIHSVDEDDIAAAATEAVSSEEGMRGPLVGGILEFIKNMSPETKAAIIALLFKLIGIK